MKKTKKMLCASACITAVLTAVTFSGCEELLKFMTTPLDDSQSYASDEWNPNEDGKENGSPSQSDSGDSENGAVIPEPDAPDSQKTVLREETDDIGHKIVYYTDGSSEDLGRVEALDLSLELPAEKYGYQYFQTLTKGDGLCALYNDLYNVAVRFHATDKDLVQTNNHYEVSDFNFSDYGLTSDEAAGVWRTVGLEYPEFFWWGNTLLLSKTTITLVADEGYASATARATAQEAIEEMAAACDGYLDGTTTFVERALTIHDYVANITEYAYETDGETPEDAIWAHNLTGGAQYGKGVCENYAKTYQYLCDLFNVECLTVTGHATQSGSTIGHAWNVIEVDGNWYNVDVTWNDGDGTSISRAWFGTRGSEFEQTHDALTPEDGWGVNYQFPMPTLSDDGLTPVRVLRGIPAQITENEANEAPMYASIEKSYDLMTDGNAYVAYLYPTTKASPDVPVLLQGASLNDDVTPTTGSLAIVGEYRAYAGGYYSLAALNAPEGLTLGASLCLQDLQFTAPALALADNVLTTGGTAVELEVTAPITGVTSSEFLVDTSEWTETTQVGLDRLTVNGGDCRLTGGGTVASAEVYGGGMLWLHGTADVTVGELYLVSANERLYIDGAKSTTKITVNKVKENNILSYQANFFVVYTSAADYPTITVNESGCRLYLTMYSTTVKPQDLGRSLITLGENVAYTTLYLYYTSGGTAQRLDSLWFEKTETGDVCAR